MKKYLIAMVLMLSIASYGQKMSQNFDVKKYAQEQTDMLKTALNLNDEQSEKVYQANLNKAYEVHKYIILWEKRGLTDGKTVAQVISEIKNDAERGSGYQTAMKNILGEAKYQTYLEKFPK